MPTENDDLTEQEIFELNLLRKLLPDLCPKCKGRVAERIGDLFFGADDQLLRSN